MSDYQLNRRRFLQAAGGVAVCTGLAGCGESGDSNEEFGEETTADAMVRVVNGVPPTADEGTKVTPDVTATQSDALELTQVIFQQAGPKGLVVAGNVENTSDQAFEEILVEATLYDSKQQEDNLFDATSNQSRQENIETGELWRWAVKFRENPEFDIDYYAVTIGGWYD